MKKIWLSKRFWGYVIIIVVYVSAVKVQQSVITARRNADIVSNVGEWKNSGKPVVVRVISPRDVKQYLKITVLPAKEEAIYEGFVSKMIQEKISAGQDLYWVKQDGRMEVGNAVSGEVVSVSEEPDMTNGMYVVRVKFSGSIPNDEEMVVIRIHYNTIDQAMNVPVESLDIMDDRYYGWVIVNGHAHRVELSVSQRDGYGAIIEEGIKAGDIFVLNGQTFLEENDLVNIIESKE